MLCIGYFENFLIKNPIFNLWLKTFRLKYSCSRDLLTKLWVVGGKFRLRKSKKNDNWWRHNRNVIYCYFWLIFFDLCRRKWSLMAKIFVSKWSQEHGESFELQIKKNVDFRLKHSVRLFAFSKCLNVYFFDKTQMYGF